MNAPISKKCEAFLEFRLVSPNVREHWTKPWARSRELHWLIIASGLPHKLCDMQLPVKVTISKVGGRKMDEHDNLRMACKPLVDILAVYLTAIERKGAGDSHGSLEWCYRHQRKGKGQKQGIHILVEEIRENTMLNNQ